MDSLYNVHSLVSNPNLACQTVCKRRTQYQHRDQILSPLTRDTRLAGASRLAGGAARPCMRRESWISIRRNPIGLVEAYASKEAQDEHHVRV